MLGKLLSLARQQALGLLALVVAIGGTAYAASDAQRTPNPRLYACVKKVGGAMRAVGATTRCLRTERKVSWNRQGIRGLRGLAGTPGATGQPGAAGQNGTNGTNGATNVTVRASTQTIPVTCSEFVTDVWFCNGSGTQDAFCAAGERAVGGGYTDLNEVYTSRPEPTTGTPTAWRVRFQGSSTSNTNQTAKSFPIYAVCAAP